MEAKPKAGRAPAMLDDFPYGLSLLVRLLILLTVLPLLYLAELAFTGDSLLKARLWSEPADRFGDFWHYRYLLQFMHTKEFFLAKDRFAYPAPCAVLYRILYHLGPFPHVVFNSLLISTALFSAAMLAYALYLHGLKPIWGGLLALSLASTSYPWFFLYDRGNIELFLYLLIAGGFWAWLCKKDQLAAALWGCAGALKIYPLVLLAIFCRRSTSRALIVGSFTFLVVLVGSFWYVGPTLKLAANGTMWGIRGFVGTYGAHTRFNELVLDHSILGGLKEIISLPFLHPAYEQIALSHIYEAIVILFGPIAFLRWRKSAPLLNQLCLLMLTLMALPPVSYDYTLIYSYLVFGVVACAYMDAERHNQNFPGLRTYVLSFAILFTAENWMDVYGFEPNGLLKSVALITVGVLLIRFPLRVEGMQERQASLT